MKKPSGIAVVVVLLGIEGIKLIIEGLGFLLSGGPELSSPFFKIGIGFLIAGSLSSASSLGIWNNRNWGRILGIISAIFIAITFAIQRSMPAVSSLIVLYLLLLHGETKKYFSEEVKANGKLAGVAVASTLLVVNGLELAISTVQRNVIIMESAVKLMMDAYPNYISLAYPAFNLILFFGIPIFIALLCLFMAWKIWNLQNWARIGGTITMVLSIPFTFAIIESILVIYFLLLHKATKKAFTTEF